jgi:hypothetical protein
MNTRKRLLMNAIVGIMLATGMIVGLSFFTDVSQQSSSMEAQDQLMAPKSSDRALAGEAVPMEEWDLVAPESESVQVDPATISTPFAVALLAGVSVFLIVRKRVERTEI